MLRSYFTLILFCLSPAAGWAGASFNLDSSYLYSTLNQQSSSSFSMVGNSGYSLRGDLALGGAVWDVVAMGEMKSAKLMAPASKTVEGNNVQTSGFGGGIRWKNSYTWLRLSYNLRDSLYLENTGTNQYNLKKVATPFYSMCVHFFGAGKGYTLGVDVEGFLPAGTKSTVAGDLKYQYAGRGSVHIDFGTKFKFGIQSGIETHQYSVASDKYFRTEFFGGISLGYVIGGAQSGATGTAGGWPIW